jgi:3-oxoacyl-(acyl-carrier-protein) synthase
MITSKHHIIPNTHSGLEYFSKAGGERPFDLQAVGFLQSVLHQATEPTLVLPMLFATPFYQVGKVSALRGLLANNTAHWLAGLGLKTLPVAAGFGAETLAFGLGSRALTHHLHGEVPWDLSSVGADLASTAMTLGLLKTAGFAGRKATQWARGLDEFQPQLWSKADHQALFWTSQASAYLGLVGSHALQVQVFPETHVPGGNIWVDSLGTHLALGIGGHAGRKALGPHFHMAEQRLALQARRLSQAALSQLNIFGFPAGMTPAAATAAGASLVHSASTISSEGPSRENIFMAVAKGEGGGRVDPRQTLGVLPTGSLTPHGDDVSTHQRAVGDKKWVARVAAYNGHLKYEGDGKYKVLKENAEKGLTEGQILAEEEVAQYFEEAVKAETGFRPLATDKPIETDWAGQIPAGFRGEEGTTEETLLKLMGLTQRKIKELRFNQSGTLITRADQFALQGLFALYRSAVQWGAPLEEIVGRDPRQMAVAVAAGLGGMNNLVDLITSSPHRVEKDGQPTFKTKPGTQPMWLPSALIDSMQGLLVAVLGPKGDSYPATLTRDSIIQTVGRIPVNVGACATGYKTFGDAAEMFKPSWPGQIATELAFFGSSEAAHGRAFARPEITGFNAMGAMETRERLSKRQGKITDGYAPLTKDVMGFWPSEGAGMGALMYLHRMIELGLPVHAAVLGYSIMGDQGGKAHPAGLGMGGLSTLMESLRMMVEWQQADPNILRYMSLHGTGTPNNNEIEPTNLLKALEAFGYEGQLKLSAFKALLGHGLGSAGAMEIALLTRSLQEQLAPGAFNLEGRALDDHVKALGNKIEVTSEVLRGAIPAAGGQSQGFAGNNATALFRHVSPQVLIDVYGYSAREVAAYYSRLSERRDVAHQWEENIRTGNKTIGEFLSWFGLGEPGTESPTVVDMGSHRAKLPDSQLLEGMVQHGIRNRSFMDSQVPKPSDSEPAVVPTLQPPPMVSFIEGAPAIRKGIQVDPSQMMVSVGRGSMLTTRGGTLATRSAAMNGVDHPQTLMYLAEEAGVARFTGRNERGREQWVRSSDGTAITPEELAQDREVVKGLLSQSGMREIPLEGMARELPVRHGGLLPEWVRGRDKAREKLGAVDEKSLKGGPLANQWRNIEWASDMGVYGLLVALEAQAGIGLPLRQLMASHRFGAAQGSAFPGADRLIEIYEKAKGDAATNKGGKDSVTYALQSALMEDPRGVYLNLIMPHLDYVQEVVKPEMGGNKELAAANLARILPETLQQGQFPNTGGVNLTCSQACASGLYALFLARLASVKTGLHGEVPMDAFMVFGVDATFSPFHTAPAVAGFSRKAPMTVADMVAKLHEQGRLPVELAEAVKSGELPLQAAWEKLPEEMRRVAMSEASAPFSRHAKGLVVAEGAAALPWFNFQKAIEVGLWPSSRLLGIHVNAGEGGNPNLASLDQGIVTATMAALQQARGHGVIPQLLQTHGTSTELNNYAEIKSLYYALRQSGVGHTLAVSAIKGLVGHTMGAAAAVDMVMGVQSLLDGEAPGLFNFRTADLDPRYAERIPEVLEQFTFSPEKVRGNFDGILVTSEGFLSADAAAVLGRFPQDIDAAAEMLRDYNFPEHVIADWKAKAVDTRARTQEVTDSLRKGERTRLDIAAEFGFNEFQKKNPGK